MCKDKTFDTTTLSRYSPTMKIRPGQIKLTCHIPLGKYRAAGREIEREQLSKVI